MSVIVISMVLVVVGFVTLMLGVLGVGEDPLQFVYASIGACLVAAVFLVIGVVRGRPSKKPVAASGGDGNEASWSGASAWGDKDADAQQTSALERDEAPARSSGAPHVQVVTAEEAAGDQRAAGGDEGFKPPTDERPAQAPEAEADEPVVVPKRSAGAAAEAGAQRTEAEEEADVDVVPAGAVRGAKKSAKKASAKRSAKKATAKKAIGKKATAKKATAKKSAGKKATAKKASGAAGGRKDAERVEEALGNVSGVGPAKRKALLEHFGSFDELRAATPSQLMEVNGVSETLAERIRRALR